MMMMIMMKSCVDYLRSEVIQVSGQRRPLQVGIRLPHVRVVRVVGWVVVVLAREVQVACKRYLRDPSPLHNVHFGYYDGPVVKMALYMLQGHIM